MIVGAVVVAAGMSSRMNDFKPMMNIGNMSISRRVVATLKQGGAERIVVVTGNNAEELEYHLAKCGVIFLRNERYESTKMFDSACIGLRYIKDKCDCVLFTPVDIPLFTASTVKHLIDSRADHACPVCNGVQGHPILISCGLIDGILADDGSGGLAGALSRCAARPMEVHVSDAGILLDADTKEDYNALLSYHNSQLIRPTITTALSKEKPILDQRIAMLLSLVDETESMRLACRRMQISYRSSWDIINSIEEQLGFEVVSRTHGGSGGGRSVLTDRGKLLLERFRAFEQDLRTNADELFKTHFTGVFGE